VWEVHYTGQHPNKTFKSEEWNSKYTVVGYESIDVPAGKFNASPVECRRDHHGDSDAEDHRQDCVGQNVQGVFRYVPEVKRWVKSVEEYYGSGGVRNERYTGELESFKLAE